MKTSPQKALASFCKGCLYDPKDRGTYTEQIEACTVTNCELYGHRPLSGKTKRLLREKLLASLPPREREVKLAQQAASKARMIEMRNKGVL